mmetsp:Transcript_124867/g.216539  ORF Transcript_124867/g.216539 Transcript_124867/m.216539 type:complete len:230 (-) Transcript_124867:126-815(-)
MQMRAFLILSLACVGLSRRLAWAPSTPQSLTAPQQRAGAQPSMRETVATTPGSSSASGLSWWTPGVGNTWDPLGLAKSPEKFERLRYVEVKHGRISMLAVLGHIVAATGYRWPGQLSNGLKFADVKGSGFMALKQLAPLDYAVILAFVGFLELRVMKEQVKGEFPGDLRNGLFKEGWDGFTDKEKTSKINKELNNGRAAMMGILGLMVHEMLNGKPYVINELLGMGQPY